MAVREVKPVMGSRRGSRRDAARNITFDRHMIIDDYSINRGRFIFWGQRRR
jgi:hypothetical protein